MPNPRSVEAVTMQINFPTSLIRIDRSVVPAPYKGPTLEGDRKAGQAHSFRQRLLEKIPNEGLRQRVNEFSWLLFLWQSGRVADDRVPTDDLVFFGRFHIPFREVKW